MAQEHLETERTLEVPTHWSFPRLAGVGRVTTVGAPRRMTQTATYLDTPGLDLLAHKHTLRRRTGGTDAGWHLKKPRKGDARLELGAPLGRGTSVVPSDLRDEVADIIGRRALVPVTVLRTRRTRRQLLDGAGTVLAVVEDDAVEATVLLAGGRVRRWREVEIELVDGDLEDLEAVTEALVGSGLTISDAPSKLARALAGVAPAKNKVKKGDAAVDVVGRYIADQVGVLQALDRPVREDLPDAVHKSRVATRRLRSTLKSFGPLFDRAETDPLRDEIKWLTGVLGGPRDAEVMRARVLDLLDDTDSTLVRGPVRSRITRSLDETHAREHARLVKALDSRRYERLLDRLVRLVQDPPASPEGRGKARSVLPGLVSKASRAVEKQAKKARKADDPDVREEAIHEIRKRAKAARYAAEAAGGLAGSDANAVAAAWTGLQEALGEHQDGVVARGVIDGMGRAARRAGEDTFTYGVLIGREVQEARRIEASYEKLLRAARKAAKKLA